MYYKLFILTLFFNLIFSFKNNYTPLYSNGINKLTMKPNDMINLLTSIKEYTIITEGNENKNLEQLMLNSEMNVYYVDVNNLLNKDEILSYLKTKYSHLDSGENLWIFYKGFILGSRNVVYGVVKKNNNKKNE
jgi:hypothetical protein